MNTHHIHHHTKHNHHNNIQRFMNQHGLHKIIAFSGGADTTLNGVPTNSPIHHNYSKCITEIQEQVIEDCIKRLRGMHIAILTGGTKWGIPYSAIKKAKEFGLKTIGIYPEAGEKYACHDLLDFDACVFPHDGGESFWGDESALFAKLLDAVVVFGGGAGTMTECAHVLKINESILSKRKRAKRHIPIKHIIAMAGSGGVADGLHFIWAKKEVMEECMPHELIYSGARAADLLIEKLNLHNNHFERRAS